MMRRCVLARCAACYNRALSICTARGERLTDFHLARHVFGARQLLVVQMAAFLRQQLVLDLHGGGAGGFQFADRAHDVQHFAIAGIGVHDERQLRCAVDAADVVAEFVQADHAQVRQAHRGRDRRARDIEAFEAGPLRQQAGHRIVRARRPQDSGPDQQGGETLPGRLLDPPVIGKPGHRTSCAGCFRQQCRRSRSWGLPLLVSAGISTV